MEQLWSQVRQLRGRPGAVAALATGVAVVWLVLAGIVGAIVVSDEDEVDLAAEDGDTSFLDDLGSDGASSSTTAPPVDADGDGVLSDQDPDDNDPNVPNAPEPVDNDGDGVLSDTDPDDTDPNVPTPQEEEAPGEVVPPGGGGAGAPGPSRGGR